MNKKRKKYILVFILIIMGFAPSVVFQILNKNHYSVFQLVFSFRENSIYNTEKEIVHNNHGFFVKIERSEYHALYPYALSATILNFIFLMSASWLIVDIIQKSSNKKNAPDSATAAQEI